MNRESIRQYRRAFALAVLSQAGNEAPLCAADVAERMQAIAMNLGHPLECFRTCDSLAMSGVLRALENDGMARKVGGIRDERAGRTLPAYVVADGHETNNIPMPPGDDDDGEAPAVHAEPVPAPAAQTHANLSTAQVYALLEFGDALAGSTARFLREIEELQATTRRRLAEVGL